MMRREVCPWTKQNQDHNSLTAAARFCVAVCPVDQRGRLAHPSTLRVELPLAQRCGGLGIPCVAVEAPLRAGDAVEAGMLLGTAATAYRRPCH